MLYPILARLVLAVKRTYNQDNTQTEDGMRAEEVEEESFRNRGLVAPLISVIMLFVVILGLSAYWWHITDLATCTTSHLKISLGQTQGTTGTSYMNVVLTNTGTGRCTLSGYPAVFLSNSSGMPLGLGAGTNSVYTPMKLTIAHGASVHALVGFPNAANFQSGACSQASNDLKLYPPGLATSLRIPFTQYGCPGFSVSALESGV